MAELAKGGVLRKKWVTHMPPAQALGATKPVRHIRCTLDDGKVSIHYFHQVNAFRKLVKCLFV